MCTSMYPIFVAALWRIKAMGAGGARVPVVPDAALRLADGGKPRRKWIFSCGQKNIQ